MRSNSKGKQIANMKIQKVLFKVEFEDNTDI